MIDLTSVFTTVKEAVVREQQDVQLLVQDAVAICMLMNLLM
jgi:hypothetical protein